MKKIGFIISLIVLLFQVQGQQPDSLYSKANRAFANEFYAEAVKQYEEILNEGYVSADLYFNLGNAYFKTKDYPRAILSYERAKKLDPSDEDILYNLEVANSRIVDKIEPVPELFLKRWWRSFIHLFPADTWATITVSGFILFVVLLALYLLSRRIRLRKIAFFTGLGILAITLLSFTMAYQKYEYVTSENEAIVFTPTITVKSSPNQNSVDLFVIHEGSKVQLLDRVGNWYEIRIASGSVGWLPMESVEKI